MAGFDRGTKRQCQSCEIKFYDLNKDPIVCPSCGEVFVTEVAPVAKTTENKKPEVKEEVAESNIEDNPDVISLDEAEDEENADEIIPDVDGVEVDDDVNADQQDTFLEEEDDDGTKVDLGVSADLGDE